MSMPFSQWIVEAERECAKITESISLAKTLFKPETQMNTPKIEHLPERHGKSKTMTYRAWQGMRQRCENPTSQVYRNYGGRGITVCERWSKSFTAFLEDMGEKNPGLSIDRIDNDGNYEPGNCRWADFKTQCRNQRKTHRYAYRGKLFTIAELGELSSVNPHTIQSRIQNYGWPVDKAVETPAAKRTNKRK